MDKREGIEGTRMSTFVEGLQTFDFVTQGLLMHPYQHHHYVTCSYAVCPIAAELLHQRDHSCIIFLLHWLLGFDNVQQRSADCWLDCMEFDR